MVRGTQTDGLVRRIQGTREGKRFQEHSSAVDPDLSVGTLDLHRDKLAIGGSPTQDIDCPKARSIHEEGISPERAHQNAVIELAVGKQSVQLIA